jgi:alpha-N-arabinofuranosidase
MEIRILPGENKNFCISPFIHSSFFEYVGKVVYDGIWTGPESDIPNIDGIRLDVIEGCKEAGVAALRWPGGCCADHYHWKNGIGKNRRPRLHPIESFSSRLWRHEFGTDEFLKLCGLCNAEPVITVNTATGTAEEFLDWYEYINGPAETKYGSLRTENGHPDPYNVTYWGLGNTDENVWHIAFNDPVEYAKTYRRFCTAIRDEKRKLKIIGLGLSMRHELPGWVGTSLDYITGYKRERGPDLLSVHHYLGAAKGYTKDAGDAVDFSDEEYYYLLDSLKRYQIDIDLHRAYILEHTNAKWPIKICFDEWGTWHPEALGSEQRQRQTMRDAIFAAKALHVFYRNSDIVEFAMETQLSNILQSLFETDGKKFYKTVTFYVMKLFKEHKGNLLADILPGEIDKDIDIVASFGENGKLTVSMINANLYNEKTVKLILPRGNWVFDDARILTCNDVRSFNSFDTPEAVKDESLRPPENHEYRLPPFSVVRTVLKPHGRL